MDRIKFGAVIRLIDGPLAPIPCVSRTAYARCTCPDETHCGLRMLMLDVRNAIAKILDRYSLADIVEITLRKMRRNGVASVFVPRSFRLDALLPSARTPLPCRAPRKLRIPSATLSQTIRQKRRREQKEKPNVH
jgi:hypothetical protein